jgi:hypothetical protein
VSLAIDARLAAAPSRAWIAAAGIVALAVAIQLRFGMMADVAWLIDCDERWLAGARPYVDFLELNPPASLWLYWPAVALARGLGLPSEAVVSVFGFAAVGAALALSALILRGVRGAGPGLALAALAALLLLPGQTFCERDHLAAVFGVPFLALALARARGRAPGAPLSLAAGFAAGAMAAIKPPYALIPALLALYQFRRSGWRAVLRSPEYYAAAALGLAYVGLAARLFPAYVANELPFNAEVYVAVREPLLALIASPGAMTFLLIAATAAWAARGRLGEPEFAVPLIAAAGAGLAYVVQGKGWVYQATPAMIYAMLAAPVALREVAPRGYPALLAGALAAGVAAPLGHTLGLAVVIGVAAGFGLDAARSGRAPTRTGLAPFAFVAAVGAACGLCTVERATTPKLEAMLAGFGPHLSLGTISEDEGLGFPLARRLRATWTMRSHSLIVSDYVRRLSARRPGEAARLAGFAERDRAHLVEDIARQRPDALLVGPTGTALHAEIWADPRVQAVMADYRRVATERKPGYTAELWLRKDFAARP